MLEIYQKILDLIHSGHSGTLVTVTEVKGSVPRHVGSKMLLYDGGKIIGSIGGGRLEKEAIDYAMTLKNSFCQKKQYKLTEDHGSLCGGTIELLFESLTGMDQFIIFGAGHIGQALSPLAKQAGFRVIVADNRPECASREKLPDADEIFTKPYDQVVTKLQFNDRSFIVIVTHGHTFDEEILHYCIEQPFAYLGMIGSKKKSATVFRHLEQKGIPDSHLKKIHSPVGIKIGAETPFEIAVSIMAEVIAVRKGAAIDALAMKLIAPKKK